MITTILDWIGPLYSSGIGYLLLAGLLFLDRGAFTGVFLPGELFVALAGVFAARGELSLPIVIAVVAVAGIAGECFSFWLGHRYGARIIRRLPLANRFEKHLDKSRGFFKKHGGRAVFIGRYVTVVGTLLPFAAGMSSMSFLRFLAFDIVALSAWSAGLAFIGYELSAQIELVDKILSRFGWGLLIVVVVVLAARFLRTRRSEAARPNA